MRISMIGTRGVPAHYGGFETAVEEVGRRLADKGHEVVVYCRPSEGEAPRRSTYRGMRLVHLPAIRSKVLETLSHTALSTGHLVAVGGTDVSFLFNSANSVLIPALRARRVPVAVHVDGLEWQRSKWNGVGRSYYRVAESLAVRWADALIADATGISDYYDSEFGATTEMISYGAPIIEEAGSDRLASLSLEPGGYHLVVARFEPENHLELIVSGFVESAARLPLVVVGSAPYNDEYTKRVRDAAGFDQRVRFLGSVWDQELLDQLYANARLYLHGHSVGGTNPSLLRAMGAGSAVSAYDVVFNREVLGDDPQFFSSRRDVAKALVTAEDALEQTLLLGKRLQERAASRYDWDEVADEYEGLARRLADGSTRRGEVSGRRRSSGSSPTPGVD